MTRGLGLLMWLSLVVLFTACVPQTYGDPYLADANARSTLAIARAQQTGTASAGQQQAQQATLEAAQTAQVMAATQTAWAFGSTQTQAAANWQATEAAQGAQTQAASLGATHAAEQTAAAYPRTMTPLAATEQAILQAAEAAAQKAQWQAWVRPLEAILPPLLWFSFLLVLLGALIMSYPRVMSLLEAYEMRVRTHRDREGETVILLNPKRGVHTLLPGRTHGHALLSDAQGVREAASPAGPAWQDRTINREQLVQLARAMFAKQAAPQKALSAMARPQPPALPGPGEGSGAEELVDAEVILLTPEHPEVQEILAEVEPRLLTAYAPQEASK